MTDDVRDLVTRRWEEYGIPGAAPATMGNNGASRRRLRQLVRR